MENSSNNSEIAVQLQGVKKRYRLGQIGSGTLREDLSSWWARIRGKEDPNTMIGVDQRLIGTTFMALNGIDLTIYKGEAVGIIGGNGAGKSTLLKLLSRVTGPTEGEIDIYGRIASMLEVGTGFNGEMTGRENVYMNGAILGMTKEEIDKKMEDIIEFSEVREFIDTPVKRYSSGMYVKLAFSVAAHLDSEIMIMDEVLAVGDMAFQQKCLEKMKDASKNEGRTVLYVSHNMNTIRRLCDRCIVLDKGRIVFEGDVEQAIAVYMNSAKAMRLSNDYNEERQSKDLGVIVHVDNITFLDREVYPIYSQNEYMQLKVKYTSKKILDNLAFRMIFSSPDSNKYGMATTMACVKAKTGENMVDLEVSLDWLAPGKYTVKFAAYIVSEFGYNEVYDAIADALTFEKKSQTEMNNGMTWAPDIWGYTMFPEIKIL